MQFPVLQAYAGMDRPPPYRAVSTVTDKDLWDDMRRALAQAVEAKENPAPSSPPLPGRTRLRMSLDGLPRPGGNERDVHVGRSAGWPAVLCRPWRSQDPEEAGGSTCTRAPNGKNGLGGTRGQADPDRAVAAAFRHAA